MNNIIHSRFVASVSDLKKNPMEVVSNGFGEAVAILNRNNPAFYCVPADMYEKLMDLVEDRELMKEMFVRNGDSYAGRPIFWLTRNAQYRVRELPDKTGTIRKLVSRREK